MGQRLIVRSLKNSFYSEWYEQPGPTQHEPEENTMYELLISILGIVVTTYIIALWATHFASNGTLGVSLIMLSITGFVLAATWVRLTWAPHLLAVAAGLGTAALFNAYIDVFLP